MKLIMIIFPNLVNYFSNKRNPLNNVRDYEYNYLDTTNSNFYSSQDDPYSKGTFQERLKTTTQNTEVSLIIS